MIGMDSARSSEQKRLLGIWDLNEAPMSLGGMIILVEELQIQRLVLKAECADICIVGDASHLVPAHDRQRSERPATLLEKGISGGSALLPALGSLEGVGDCLLCETIPALHRLLRANPHSYSTWPALGEHGLTPHRYGNTLHIQRFYLDNGFIPYISCRDEPLRWATRFLANHVSPFLPVVVHLKSIPHEQGCSNANAGAWLAFFNHCHKKYNVKFILIGVDEIDSRIRGLPNVLVAQDMRSNLSRDLALIQTAFIFMGMASGPCSMALFSGVPYLIYKNPDHHPEEMELELGKDQRFAFATPSQKLLRVFETTENLISEFANLHAYVKPQDWEKKLENLQQSRTHITGRQSLSFKQI